MQNNGSATAANTNAGSEFKYTASRMLSVEKTRKNTTKSYLKTSKDSSNLS